MTQTLRIGAVAAATGLSTAAIRFYESEGVLPKPHRSESGYRGYSTVDVELVQFVSRLRALEFPLNDVREIVALRRDDKAPCSAVRSAISRELSAIESRIADLERLRGELTALQTEADGLPDNWPTACVCNIIEQTRP